MSMSEQSRSRLADIRGRLDNFITDHRLCSEVTEDGSIFFLSIFKDACATVRDAERAQEACLDEVVGVVDGIINEAICFEDDGAKTRIYDFIPSFAHTDDGESPLVNDGVTANMLGAGYLDALVRNMDLLVRTARSGEGSPTRRVIDVMERIPELRPSRPYDASLKPHRKSTLLARFRKDIPTLTTSSMPPSSISNIIYQARCEATSEPTCLPVRLSISQAGSCVALAATGGWRNRYPALTYYMSTDRVEDDKIPDGHNVEVGLSNIAYDIATDEDRKLIFLADSDRIESYNWEQEALHTHTLQSGLYCGAIVCYLEDDLSAQEKE